MKIANKNVQQLALMLAGLLLAFQVATPAHSAEFSGGLLSNDFTMSKSSSPFTITQPIQIPEGVTLTVEPGVVINVVGANRLFWVKGAIDLAGNASEKIRINGSTSAYFYLEKARTAQLKVRHTLIDGQGSGSIIPPTGHEQNASVLIENSEFIDIPGFNYLWYPNGAEIRGNVFMGTGGFGAGTRALNVVFENNLFIGNPTDYFGNRFWIEGWANYEGAEIRVQGNEFRGATLNVLTAKVDIIAQGNFWGTMDPIQIEKAVLDRRDSLEYEGRADVTNPLGTPVNSPSSSIILSERATQTPSPGPTASPTPGSSLGNKLSPILSAFVPLTGRVGTKVIVTGANFRNVTEVRVGGKPAKFTLLNSKRISFVVPKTAKSGKISIKTESGTVVSIRSFTKK